VKPKTQNVTLSLPVSLLRQFRVYAAEQNESMSRLAAQAIRDLVGRRDERDIAGQWLIEHFRNAPDRGTGGKYKWNRAELYEERLGRIPK
jgi:hypothetical protein